jgi:P-type Mg2+ transporter
LKSYFAEIEPNQRDGIILALKHTRKNVVSCLEDGINDVSALHAANASIVVDTLADLGKEAAAFVTLKELVVLPKGVKEVGGGHLLDDDRYVHA